MHTSSSVPQSSLQLSRSVSIACLRPHALRHVASPLVQRVLQRSSAAAQVSASGAELGIGSVAGMTLPGVGVGTGVAVGTGTGTGTGVGSRVAIGRGVSSHASGTKCAATSSTLAIVSQSSLQVSRLVALVWAVKQSL